MADVTLTMPPGTDPARVRRAVALLADVLAGRAADPTGAVEAVLTRAGLVLLGLIQAAFVRKSEGGTDEMGVSWPALSPVTLALRRVGSGKRVLERHRRQVAALPPERRAAQKVAERLLLETFRGMTPEGRKARRAALSLLRKRRKTMAPTRYAEVEKLLRGQTTLKRAQEIAELSAGSLLMRDTGALLNSLTPQLGSPGQVLRLLPGVIEVGTSTAYAKYHQSAEPRKQKKDGSGPVLPRRQIVPGPGELPAEWRRAVVGELRAGFSEEQFWATLISGVP